MNRKDLEKLGLTQETLEKAGLEPDVLEQIIVLHGKDIEKHKAALTAADASTAALQAQLTEAGATIEGFKKLDPEGLVKAVDAYKAAAEKAKTDAELQVAELKFSHALESELKAAKVKDPADIIPHLKKDMLKLGEDGKLIGLSEQLTPLQESKPYLFEEEEKENEEKEIPQIVAGSHNRSVIGDTTVAAARIAAGLKSEA